MQINYTKSELIPLGLESDEVVMFAEIFGCPAHEKLSRADLQPLVDNFFFQS
jgi:hypothetical protein